MGGFEPPSSLPILLDVNDISILFISSVCSAVNLRLPSRLESFFPVASFMITPYPAEVAFWYACYLWVGPRIWDQMSFDDPKQSVGFFDFNVCHWPIYELHMFNKLYMVNDCSNSSWQILNSLWSFWYWLVSLRFCLQTTSSNINLLANFSQFSRMIIMLRYDS